jgi:16S rRNA (cytosine967-C5)-methyltransferase
LRDLLHERKNLPPETKREVSEAVFTYYRWRGWLANETGIRPKLAKALKLTDRFRENPFSMPAEHLRGKAVPRWVLDEVDASDAWLRALLRPPKLWLRARPGQARTLAKKLDPAKVTGVGDAVLFKGQQDLFATPEFAAGAFEIQDICSQVVGLVCAPEPGQTWWDVCAGEGGKTMHLSDLMQNKGLIWASDRAQWRLDRLKRRAGRAQVFNYRAVIWDGGPHLPTKTKFDGVLLDAPCSGLGTWHRNPHAKWTTTPQDVRELAELQRRLLDHTAPAVKEGGKLVYAVCTLTRTETTDVVRAFEAAHPEFVPLPLPNPLQTIVPPQHPLWLWPQQTHGNGMFIAAWQRKAR